MTMNYDMGNTLKEVLAGWHPSSKPVRLAEFRPLRLILDRSVPCRAVTL